MKRERMWWCVAAVLCLVPLARMTEAQGKPATRTGTITVTKDASSEAAGDIDVADDADDLDLDLLAADVPAGHGAGPGGHEMRMGGHGAGDLHAKLNLTDDQKDRLADIHERQARRAIPIEGDLRIAQLDMHKLMRADKPDPRAIDAQIDKMAGLRASLQKSGVAALLEAHTILTPAQLKIMRETRGGMMHGMMGRHMGMHHGMMGMGMDGSPMERKVNVHIEH